jgi:beta-lactamase class A
VSKKRFSEPGGDLKVGIIAGIGFLLGVLVTISVTLAIFYSQPTLTIKALRQSDIAPDPADPLIDPIIGMQSSQVDSPDYAELQNQVELYITKQQKSDGLIVASVKFGDLEKGEGFIVDTEDQYNPASLAKVPIMMAYYEIAENDPSILTQELTYSGGEDLNDVEEVRSPIQLTPGQSYTVEQLVEHMIRYSDNNAAQMLLTNLETTNQYSVFTSLLSSLGVNLGPSDMATDSLTVESYSIFFRVLYNATYLDRDYSEKALTLLTETDFTQGLDVGVPNEVMIAQKFGEGKIAGTNGVIIANELQDCGIVYYPNHPYLLCIMTKGDTLPNLETTIGGISHIVYQDMETRYPSSDD